MRTDSRDGHDLVVVLGAHRIAHRDLTAAVPGEERIGARHRGQEGDHSAARIRCHELVAVAVAMNATVAAGLVAPSTRLTWAARR